MFIRVIQTALLALAAAGALAASPARVILVGDSTMASRTGYGDALCQRLAATCINLARGGRSSASFRSEGRWDQVQALLRQPGPTYVLIQFGHNDQPGKPGRSTDLVTQFPANLARYAAEAKALGAIPVLVTPLARRSFKGRWLDNDLAPWAAATRAVARAGKTMLIDLNGDSVAALQRMGQAGADTLAQEGAFDRTHLGRKGADLFSLMVASRLPLAAERGALPPVYVARQAAPDDGWAGAVRGGGAALGERTFTVTSRAELLAAIGGNEPKIIQVAGVIDMQEQRPFASTADQAARSSVRLNSHTTLIGVGPDAGFVNATISVAGATEVIIRNLHFRNPCDVGPVWDPNDGPKGSWNSQFDSIVVSASTHVWIDHNSFADTPSPAGCHDGALDINKGSDFITVSYNHFALHEKNILVGSGDNASGDAGHLRVTFSNNLFENVASRSPRVRFGRVHAFNNYHVGSRKHGAYPHDYSIGVGKQADIIAENNAFDIEAASRCEQVVHVFDRAASFRDEGSLLNGKPLDCGVPPEPGWRVPYPYHARPASAVREHVLANAGAGKPLLMRPTFSPLGDRVPADTPLRIELGYTPALEAVQIYRKADGKLADTIHPGMQTVAIGLQPARLVRKERMRVRGRSIVIEPHQLAHDTEYVVKTLGLRWTFRTGPAPRSATVDDDGPADFRTVQGALDHAMRGATRLIEIRNGRYEELLFLRGVDGLTIRGESRDGVFIHAANSEAVNPGSGVSQTRDATSPTGGRALMLVESADLLTLENLTFENTTLRATSPASQAETLHFNSDSGRLVARNARFFSEQDTLQLKGYAWFYRTLVAGNVDFIWGANRVALFEESEIRSVADSAQRTPGGWLVQARTVSAQDLGFVFLNSRLTHGPGVSASYLARSPGTASTWDNVTFINCAMDNHIAAEGWARSPKAPNGDGWREYGSRDLAGKALDLSARAGKVLSADEARPFLDRASIFSAFNGGEGWAP